MLKSVFPQKVVELLTTKLSSIIRHDGLRNTEDTEYMLLQILNYWTSRKSL